MKTRIWFLPEKKQKHKQRFWDIRKITFSAILIAIAVVFAIIGTQIIAVASLPQFKVSFIGLPIKITGFIFGPIVGVLTGLIADLISFMMMPIFFHPLYTLATVMNGLISGLVGWFFVKFLGFYFGYNIRVRHHNQKIKKYKAKIAEAKSNDDSDLNQHTLNQIDKWEINIIHYEAAIKKWEHKKISKTLININWIVSSIILVTIIIILSVCLLDHNIIHDDFIAKTFMPNRYGLLAFLVTGFSTMLIYIAVIRFKLESSKFVIIIPIIIFSAFIEIINVPILSSADALMNDTKNLVQDALKLSITHVITSPIKIWFNLTIIYYSYKVIVKLINKNTDFVY